MGGNNWGVFLSRGFHNPGLRGLSLSVQLERHPLPLATILCIVKKTKQPDDWIIYLTRVLGTFTGGLTNCAFRFKLLPNFSNSCFWAPPAVVIHLSRENKELFFKFIMHGLNPAEKLSSLQSSSSQYSLSHIIFSLECWSAGGVFCCDF